MGNATTTRIDLGNNETASRGITSNADGTYTAMTFTKSRDFKTLKGAQRWLGRNTTATSPVKANTESAKPYGLAWKSEPAKFEGMAPDPKDPGSEFAVYSGVLL